MYNIHKYIIHQLFIYTYKCMCIYIYVYMLVYVQQFVKHLKKTKKLQKERERKNITE